PAPAPAPADPPLVIAPTPGRSTAARRGPSTRLLVAAAALVVLVLLGVYALLSSGGSGGSGSAGGKASPSSSTSPSASPTPSPSASATPARPTAAGMKAFISDYVRLTGEDPSRSWKMLTPKFQRESGGFSRYSAFWDAATNGRVLSIQANPDDLTVSYQVRFDNFDNGPGPTVLQLRYADGTYRIDGESSAGFTPAG
ncbi:MAG: protein kinase, partial [Marmoricola sp.]|nr:protein kinase [Marmoricola sp.]